MRCTSVLATSSGLLPPLFLSLNAEPLRTVQLRPPASLAGASTLKLVAGQHGRNPRQIQKASFQSLVAHGGGSVTSRAPAGGTAGVAFEAGAVADQCEVAAFLAAVAFVAFDAGGANALEPELVRVFLLRRCRDGEGAVELGRRRSAGAAVQHRQLAADIAAGGAARDLRPGVVVIGAREGRFGFALADRVGQQIAWLDMGQIAAIEVGDRQFAEDIVEYTGRHLDRIVALDDPRRLEPGEGERLDKLLERYAVLQTHRNRDRKIVHQ